LSWTVDENSSNLFRYHETSFFNYSLTVVETKISSLCKLVIWNGHLQEFRQEEIGSLPEAKLKAEEWIEEKILEEFEKATSRDI